MAGGEPEDELQVLGDEHQDAENHEVGQQVRAQRCAEGRRAEQSQVDQRVVDAELAGYEHDPAGDPCGQGEQRQHRDSGSGDFLEAVDHRQDSCERQRDTDQVRAGGSRIAVLGQQRRAEDQQHRHHRHAEQERRAPPKPLQ